MDIKEGILNLIAAPVDITMGELTDQIITYLKENGMVQVVKNDFPKCVVACPALNYIMHTYPDVKLQEYLKTIS